MMIAWNFVMPRILEKLKIFSKTSEPEYRQTGICTQSASTMYRMLNQSLVVRSYRRPMSCGIVVMPLRRYFGAAHSASMMQHGAATISNAIALMPTTKVCPFEPTSCSAERLVSSSEPAITRPGSPRPARN